MKENVKKIRDKDFTKPSSGALFATLTIVLSIALIVISIRVKYLSDGLQASLDGRKLCEKYVISMTQSIEEKEATINRMVLKIENLKKMIAKDRVVCLTIIKAYEDELQKYKKMKGEGLMDTLNEKQVDKLRNKIQVISGSITLLKIKTTDHDREMVINRMEEALDETIKVLNGDTTS